jgi:hypothetical protein
MDASSSSLAAKETSERCNSEVSAFDQTFFLAGDGVEVGCCRFCNSAISARRLDMASIIVFTKGGSEPAVLTVVGAVAVGLVVWLF